jgi:hypothetical protein
MPRPRPEESEAVNPDSFLDIVASVVSIMIIMVVMEGSRIRNTPVDPSLVADSPEVKAAVEKGQAAEASLRGEILKTAREIQNVGAQAQVRMQQRDALATVVAALERKVADRRQELDAPSQRQFDLQRKLGDARAELNQLQESQRETLNSSPQPIELASFSTAISRTVETDEVHFRLRAGRIAVVPLEDLMKRVHSDVQEKISKLRSESEITETVGPIDGFRLRYTLERQDFQPDDPRHGGRSRGGSRVRMSLFEILPVTEPLGETLAEAQADGSIYHQVLSGLRPEHTAVTLWVYHDTFPEFRKVREELHRAGFMVAARPLPDGVLIRGSPDGAKSSAE